MIYSKLSSVSAFAPATCANLAVGFDILGFAIESVGDIVTLKKRNDNKVIVSQMSGQENVPTDPYKNTASVVILKLLDELNIDIGFNIYIQKGISLGSGMGGSAASAVAALVAFNSFLKNPLSKNELAHYALFGEEAACGQKHADNIAPCIFGGITLIQSLSPLRIIQLPSQDLYCVIIHPHLRVDTKEARLALSKNLPLSLHIKQSANLSTFIAALYEHNNALIKDSLHDFIIEEQRAKFVNGFYEVKNAALHAGALASSFSGSGPSMFALTESKEKAEKISLAMRDCFKLKKIETDYWISPMNSKGAHIIQTD